jgi:hypothetical protein
MAVSEATAAVRRTKALGIKRNRRVETSDKQSNDANQRKVDETTVNNINDRTDPCSRSVSVA